jgi:cation:H+ antiporter
MVGDKFMPLINELVSPRWLWFTFLLLASIVVFLAIMLSKCVAALANKTKLGGAFLGGFVLSLVTSLPELVSSLTASLIDNPNLSYNNVYGANALTGTMIAIIDILFIKKMLFGNISKQNKQIISILIIINTLTLISLLTNNGLVINLGPLSISGLYFALFVFYVYFVYVMYNNTEISEESNKSGLEHLSLKAVVTLFLLVAVSIIVISSILTNVVDLMSGEEGYNLGNSLAGALLLSICTALPETVSAFSLAKMGQGNMAIGGIVGSHLFNLTILFYGDLFYLENATFDNLINSSDYQGFMGLVLVNVVISLFLFVSSNRRVVKNKFIYLLPSVAIVVSYLIGWFMGLIC